MKDLFKLIDKLDDMKYLLKLQNYLRENPFHILTNNKDGFSPFTYTLANKNLDFFKILYNYYLQNKELFQQQSDFNIIDARDANKNRPIDIIINLLDKSERLEKLEFLINNTTANLDVQDIYGNTPLHILAKKNDDDGVELLRYSNRVNVNKLNKSKQSPIYYAIRNNNQNILDLLIEAGGILQGHVESIYVNYRDDILRSRSPELIEYLMEYDKVSKKKLKSKLIKYRKTDHIRKIYKHFCSNLELDNLEDLKKYAIELNIDPANKTKKELCSNIARKVVIRQYNPSMSFQTDY